MRTDDAVLAARDRIPWKQQRAYAEQHGLDFDQLALVAWAYGQEIDDDDDPGVHGASHAGSWLVGFLCAWELSRGDGP
jgi:hypothetical protein